ncbi:MAG: hypothetical protein IKG22_10130 [Atopobiaceae bacterium]|nr:hypothetical protein [Atopobiaceae bacterium]
MEFVESLLQMRFLFDKCIVKRECLGGGLEGRWSLKARVISGLTDGADGWRGGACQGHEAAMLGLLRQTCGAL